MRPGPHVPPGRDGSERRGKLEKVTNTKTDRHVTEKTEKEREGK